MGMGYVWLIGAMVLSGVWYILLREGSQGTSSMVAQIVNVCGTIIGVALLFVPALWVLRSRGEPVPFGPRWPILIVAGVVICVANYLTFKAYSASVPSGLVPVVINLSCIIPAVYGFAVLRERLHPLQILGFVLALVAATLISYPYRAR